MTTIDAAEVDKFDALAQDWWAIDGPMAPLHKMNPVRLSFIREQLVAHFGLDPDARQPLQGLRILDVGCGCGLLAEPLTRLGAQVTAIDPSQQNIEVAMRHAKASGLEIDYRPIGTDTLLQQGVEPFDVVTCLEVVEHSPAGDLLVLDLSELVRPGGMVIMSTLNRTAKSFIKAIIGAEYLLGWLPRGTHNWRRFVPPSTLARWLREAKFRVHEVTGVGYDAVRDQFHLSPSRDTNYLISAERY